MINVLNKKDCCGCNACTQACPQQSISLLSDSEGFLYPHVNIDTCIDCGICDNVCPIINRNNPVKPIIAYAAKNLDEDIRLKSSSGGIFTLLAEKVISEGGVVFGVKFDENWEVVHSYTDTINGLIDFRGSKYVQSKIGDSFKLVKQFLTTGRTVLFSGTPCQVSGLKNFLHKKYINLLTVEVVCHGVPSPKVWKDYLNYRYSALVNKNQRPAFLQKKFGRLQDIAFRDKSNGWKNFGIKFCYSNSTSDEIKESEVISHKDDIFMKGFLSNLYLRPSCYQCSMRQASSGADISIADYWGIQIVRQEFDDDKGVSAVIINTDNGLRYFENIKNSTRFIVTDYAKIVQYNPCIISSVSEPKQRKLFWEVYPLQGLECINSICESMNPSPISILVKRIIRKIKSIIKS